MITIIAFIVVFSIVVLSHELGHFFFSRLVGIKVLELGLGLGPRIAKFVRNGIPYTINLLPLGGFIKIAGINPETESKEDKYKRKESYLSKSPLQKFMTVFGGPLANIVAAFLIFIIVFSFFGIPSGISNEISNISENSEAQRIGLMPGDKIIQVNGQTVIKMQDAVKIIHGSAGRRVFLTIKRSGQTLKLSAVPRFNERMKAGLIGFTLKPSYKRVNIFRSIWEAGKQTVGFVMLFIYILGMLITGKIPLGDVSGPVGIAQFTGQAAGEGIMALLMFTAFLSINLGVLNLLPIPALDGGRLVFIIIEAIRRKPIDIKLENKIHYIGIVFLLSLFLVITINDVLRIFGR
ncbi:RIP metalloprotease RseP [Candidatus Margulisiibacteriota bacterium]